MAVRILHIVATHPVGGEEAFLERLVAGLSEKGFEQRVLLRADAARAARLSRSVQAARCLRFGGAVDLATPSRIAAEVAEFRPHVEFLLMDRAARRMPARFWVGDRAIRVARIGGYLNLAPFSRLDRLVGIAPHIVDWLRTKSRVEVDDEPLPNFVETQAAMPLSRGMHRTPESAKLVVAMGRFHADKSFDTLLSAMTHLPDVWLWLIGAGPLEGVLRAQVSALGLEGRVRLLPWIEDPAAAIEACDLLACSSPSEGLPNVVLEAWARNKPVVSTAWRGADQIFAEDAGAALVPVGDVLALGSRIGQVLHTPALAESLGRQGRSRHDRLYGRTSVLARYGAFLERMADLSGVG